MQAFADLGGAVDAGQAETQAFLRGFEQFSFLWQRDIVTEYAKFVAAGPVLEVGHLITSDLHASVPWSYVFTWQYCLSA